MKNKADFTSESFYVPVASLKNLERDLSFPKIRFKSLKN